jgi:hypothetical protein
VIPVDFLGEAGAYGVDGVGQRASYVASVSTMAFVAGLIEDFRPDVLVFEQTFIGRHRNSPSP